jgi:GNAT superfamily N-acetyltransferase
MPIRSNAAEPPGATVVIRRASPDDAERLSALCAEHARFEGLDFVAAGHVGRLRAALAQSSTLMVWLAESRGATLGYAAATLAYSTLDAMAYLHMDCLYLRADHRGRRIGTALLDRVAALGASLGLPRIEWQTPAWNHAAARFYRRHGAAERAKLRFVLTLGARARYCV